MDSDALPPSGEHRHYDKPSLWLKRSFDYTHIVWKAFVLVKGFCKPNLQSLRITWKAWILAVFFATDVHVVAKSAIGVVHYANGTIYNIHRYAYSAISFFESPNCLSFRIQNPVIAMWPAIGLNQVWRCRDVHSLPRISWHNGNEVWLAPFQVTQAAWASL